MICFFNVFSSVLLYATNLKCTFVTFFNISIRGVVFIYIAQLTYLYFPPFERISIIHSGW